MNYERKLFSRYYFYSYVRSIKKQFARIFIN